MRSVILFVAAACVFARGAWAAPKSDKSELKFNHGKTAFAIAWSPDGKWFVIGGPDKFEKYNAAGKKLLDIKLTKFASGSPSVSVYWDGNESVSPDGTAIAFRASANGEDAAKSSRIWILDLTSMVVGAISDGQGDALKPSWSNDGASVYYTVKEGGKYTAHVFDVKTKADKVMCDQVDDLKRIIATRDGRLLVATKSTLALASATCDSREQIGPTVGTISEVILSPSGKRVAIDTIEGDLWSVDLMGGVASKVGTRVMMGAAWFDDDTVVFSRTTDEKDWHPSEVAFAKSDGSSDGVVMQRASGCSDGQVFGAASGHVVAFEQHCTNKDDHWIGFLPPIEKWGASK